MQQHKKNYAGEFKELKVITVEKKIKCKKLKIKSTKNERNFFQFSNY